MKRQLIEPQPKASRPKLPERWRADYVAYGHRGWIGAHGKRYACRDDWGNELRWKGTFTL